jgi:ribosome-binding ATPase YchF (GTP1/OBG family)
MNDLSVTSLSQVIVTCNTLLHSQCFYTIGVQEAHSWSIDIGTTAQRAAGKIHSDLEKNFICAEVIKPTDYLELGETQARAQGKMTIQGKNYMVENGDIMVFRVQGQKGR